MHIIKVLRLLVLHKGGGGYNTLKNVPKYSNKLPPETKSELYINKIVIHRNSQKLFLRREIQKWQR